MSWIKEQLQGILLSLRIKHMHLCNHQSILVIEETKTLTYAIIELKKSILEFKIAVIRALLGESQ